MLTKFLISYSILFCLNAFSHRGGTIKSGELKGCHINNISGTFHCHSSSDPSLINKEFKSKKDAYNHISSGKNSAIDNSNKYNRKKFKHWIDLDKNCLNTRAEVLKLRSLIDVTISECKVKHGLWKDFYYDEILKDASQIDIDHIVPLKEAWISGAKFWNSNKRQEFANDMENLVITNLKYNRKKRAKTPLLWIPIDKTYACKYMDRWLHIKEKYGLKVSAKLIIEYGSMKCE